MNNFLAMTEERRQELIDFMQGSRTYRYEEWSRLSKLRDQITLAALTAKSIAWIETGTDGFQRGSRLINYFTSDIQGFDNGTLIYAAPPAPVLRVPDEVFEKAYNQHLNGLLCGDNNKTAAKQFLQDCINSQSAPPEASNEQ